MDFPAKYHNRQYVDVITRWRDDGRIMPLSVCWADGRTFHVNRVLGDPVSNAPASATARTLRYTVQIGTRTTYLYLERDTINDRPSERWYVEVPQDQAPYRYFQH